MRQLSLLLSALTVCIFLTSCSTTKSLKSMQKFANVNLLSYEKKLHDEVLSLDSAAQPTILNCATWQKDKDDFVKMIKDYKDKNEIIRQKSNKSGTGFIIGGTTLGVGGGIYGLFSNSEPKGAAITSLLTGSLTALVGSLNLERKAERANTCSDFLNSILLDFDAYWGVARCPSNKDDLAIYLKSKDDIIERLKAMKCFGLPATGRE